MNLAVVGKTLGGAVFSGLSIFGIANLLLKSQSIIFLDKNETKNIHIYTISLENAGVSFPEIEIEKEKSNRNYLCSFGAQNYECEISSVDDVDSSKKWSDIDVSKNENSTITKDTLKIKNKFYKIKINKEIGEWNKDQTTIKVLFVRDKTKQYANLKQLFAINSDNTADQYTKTQYFIVKTSNSITKSTETSFSYTCLATKEQSTETPTDVCNIYNFASSSTAGQELNALNFEKWTSETNVNMESQKFYVVDLKTEKTKSEAKNIKIKQNNKTDISIETEIIPAIHVTEKKGNIFVLKKFNS